jgi:hypothetical protein
MNRILRTRVTMLVALAAAVATLAGCSTTTQIANGNLCVSAVSQGIPAPGSPVLAKACEPGENQQWAVGGPGRITGPGNLCLDVEGGVGRDGAPVIYVPCNGAPSQFWTPMNNTIVGVGGRCLDNGGDPVRGGPLVINRCNGSLGQSWVIVPR